MHENPTPGPSRRAISGTSASRSPPTCAGARSRARADHRTACPGMKLRSAWTRWTVWTPWTENEGAMSTTSTTSTSSTRAAGLHALWCRPAPGASKLLAEQLSGRRSRTPGSSRGVEAAHRAAFGASKQDTGQLFARRSRSSCRSRGVGRGSESRSATGPRAWEAAHPLRPGWERALPRRPPSPLRSSASRPSRRSWRARWRRSLRRARSARP